MKEDTYNLSVEDAARCMKHTVGEVRKQCRSGELESTRVVVDGKPRRKINELSMPPAAQAIRRRETLRDLARPETNAGENADALSLSDKKHEQAFWWYQQVVRPCLNWKAAGFSSLRRCAEGLAKQHGLCVRTILRKVEIYNAAQSIAALANQPPGPAPRIGTGNADVDRLIEKLFIAEKWNCVQIHREVCEQFPDERVSYSKVKRVTSRLDGLQRAEREGPEKRKAAIGHVDRTYDDILSLARVDVDEWITDWFSYDPEQLIWPRYYHRRGGMPRYGRFYLLTMLDERSMLPNEWALVESPNQEHEIDLLCRLITNWGVPGLLNSDRGRFRGREFGGAFLSFNRVEKYSTRDGILDRLGIARNLPREHNPRGSRLERFHKELANFARTMPGWCGASTAQRQSTGIDQLLKQHEEWVKTGRGQTPLLSKDQSLERINQFMAQFRELPSRGTSMYGCTPSMMFRKNTPVGGFRRVSESELAWATAQTFPDVRILPGGIVELPGKGKNGKARYSSPELILIQGQRRDVRRFRHDDGRIGVMPRQKGESVIFAARRTPVGFDQTQLSAAMEDQGRLRKAADAMFNARGDDRPKLPAPKAEWHIHPAEFFALSEPEPVLKAEPVPQERPEPSLIDFEPISTSEL
jgi:hypothetical protein